MISRGIGKSAARSVARSLSQFGSGGVSPSYDTDAQTYITAVEAADGESLETGVKDAINAFVVGCKSDGIWTAIKASCILAGARTLTGALVPLVGTAPTNNNFVSGDYSRTAGLTGDGSTKYLDSNRNNNADPQNSHHIAVFPTTLVGGSLTGMVANFSVSLGNTNIGTGSCRSRCVTNTTLTTAAAANYLSGISRASFTEFQLRSGGGDQTAVVASVTPIDTNLTIFAWVGTSSYNSSTLAFYSIGESLDLALLDTRVTTLITSIGTALA